MAPTRHVILEGVPCTPAMLVAPSLPGSAEEAAASGPVAPSRALKTGPKTLETEDLEHFPPGEEEFVVSVATKTGHWKLHWLRACPRVPGVHYANFEHLGIDLPPPELYHSVCKHCWAKSRGSAFEAAETEPDEAESGTSGSDGAGEFSEPAH